MAATASRCDRGVGAPALQRAMVCTRSRAFRCPAPTTWSLLMHTGRAVWRRPRLQRQQRRPDSRRHRRSLPVGDQPVLLLAVAAAAAFPGRSGHGKAVRLAAAAARQRHRPVVRILVPVCILTQTASCLSHVHLHTAVAGVNVVVGLALKQHGCATAVGTVTLATTDSRHPSAGWRTLSTAHRWHCGWWSSRPVQRAAPRLGPGCWPGCAFRGLNPKPPSLTMPQPV